MPAESFFSIFRSDGITVDQIARTDTPDPARVRRSESVYTRQQIAAFKAHITMLRNKLGDLQGTARDAAVAKLARYEARLAAALS